MSYFWREVFNRMCNSVKFDLGRSKNNSKAVKIQDGRHVWEICRQLDWYVVLQGRRKYVARWTISVVTCFRNKCLKLISNLFVFQSCFQFDLTYWKQYGCYIVENISKTKILIEIHIYTLTLFKNIFKFHLTEMGSAIGIS